ncbi:MAG: ABC transporter permease, partial [Gammaproteobacteria bacterium HGW-Gammaproteobacteria-10]
AAMMLGGNIQGSTRTITTAIALETGKGDFEMGLALGILLLSIAFLINLALQMLPAKPGI